MKKNAPLCVLCLLLGCLAGLALNFSLWDGGGLFSAYIPSGAAVPGAEAPSPESSTDTCDPTDNTPLLEAGDAVLEALKRGDIQVLAALIDTERGVTFTPYSTVDPRSDLTFLPDQFTEAGINGTRYVWGATQGKGVRIADA